MSKKEGAVMSGDMARIKKIHAIPHFHYDVEWWKTEDGYNKDVAGILDRAFEMLDEYPDFTYSIDQALALRPYWDSHPDMREKIRRWVKEGRIELIGGTFCSPDENIPTGEALARQYIYGKRFLEDVVGGRVETAWEIDAFGHPAQFAQIVAKANLKQFAFARGVQNWRDPDAPIHFYWESPDGTRVLCNWFAAHYIGFAPPSPTSISPRLFRSEVESRVEYEGIRTRASILMFPFGSDFTVPDPKWVELVRRWKSKSRTPEIEFSLPRTFFDELRAEGAEPPVIRGELNPLLTGCYESREKVKKLCRRSQYKIMDAEKWASIAWARGLAEYPRERLDRAWELVLENDFHDIVCGTGTDKVYRNTIARYEEAMSAIEEVGKASRAALAALADTRGGGEPVIAFNSLNWQRRELIEVPLESINADPDADGEFVATGPAGEPIACQRSGDSLLALVTLPPMGYGVLNVKQAPKQGVKAPDLSVEGLSAENAFLRISIDPKSGCISSVYDKQLGRETLDPSRWLGNEILAEEDAGNLWTVQKTGLTWEGKDYRSEVRHIENGPLRIGFESRGKHKDMNRVQRVYLTAGSRRIDFETEIDFKGKDMRVKAMFAPSISGKSVFETPFYAQPREDGHWCAQNWADISNGRRGLAVLNAGNPGMDAERNTLGLVLFRGVSVFSAAYVRYLAKNWTDILRASNEAKEIFKKGLGMAEWALYKHHGITLREWSSGGGPEMKGGWSIPDHIIPWLLWMMPADCWERGKHTFKYAIYPHEGDWRAAHLPRRGLEFNTPVTVVSAASKGKGALGRAATLFSAGDDEAAIAVALKKAEKSEALVARVYDSIGRGAKARLSLGEMQLKSCRKINITEDIKGSAVRLALGSAVDNISPWEIASYLMSV
jgi:alpha-mannosidase